MNIIVYETECNFISDNIVRKIKIIEDKNEKAKYFFEYLKMVSKDKVQYRQVMKDYNALDKKGKVNFMKEVEDKGIYINMPPFWKNLNLEDIEAIYKKYDFIKPYKCTVKIDGKTHDILTPLVIGDQYIMKLRHEPSTKFSARSTSYINLQHSPSKSLNYKKHRQLYSHTPIRFGDQELTNMMISMMDESIKKLLTMYSSNEEHRYTLVRKLLTENLFKLNQIDIDPDIKSNNRRILDAYIKCLGLKLNG